MHRALIVEDDPAWRQILTELLTDAGLAVDTADSLSTAVTVLRAAPHRLAVVDLSLGGSDHRNQDGLAVLDAVRKQDPHCVAILLSGYATVEIAVAALKEYGALTCLRKEIFRRAEFRRVVQEAMVVGRGDTGGLVEPIYPSADEGRAPRAGPGESEIARVLVVEDDAGWRSILHELLTDAGLAVVLGGSYAEALGRLRRTFSAAEPRFALAVVDLSLASSQRPDLNADGFRLLAAAKSSRIPAIVVSGAASPQDAERAYAEFGVLAFVEKQAFDRRAFIRTVREALVVALPSPLDVLTPREREVLDLLVMGLTNNQIADRLVVSPNTIKRHLKAIFEKLDVSTRSAAVAKVMALTAPGGALPAASS